MKDAEDEAFDDLARKQGAWGGGFPAKRKMTMDKIHAEFYEKYVRYRTAFPKEYTAPQVQEDRIKYGTSWEKDGERIDPMSVYKEPAQERCCYHDSDCAVHNMPAYPAGPCDCTQQFKFWSVTGEYERQAFACLSNAEAYCKGLNATYPEGNYIVSPLYTTLPQREWVGLTDAEIDEGNKQSWVTKQAWESAVWWASEKLKEKNNGL